MELLTVELGLNGGLKRHNVFQISLLYAPS